MTLFVFRCSSNIYPVCYVVIYTPYSSRTTVAYGYILLFIFKDNAVRISLYQTGLLKILLLLNIWIFPHYFPMS